MQVLKQHKQQLWASARQGMADEWEAERTATFSAITRLSKVEARAVLRNATRRSGRYAAVQRDAAWGPRDDCAAAT